MRTSLDPQLQAIADKVLRDGLVHYDRAMASRGPVAKIDAAGNWPQALAAVPPPAGLYDWQLAVVLSTDAKIAKIGLARRQRRRDPAGRAAPGRAMSIRPGKSWARPSARPADALAVGDVIVVEP